MGYGRFTHYAPTPEGCVTANRINLSVFTVQFQMAVEVFELIEGLGTIRGGRNLDYKIIPARDAALNLYHFHCCLLALKKQVPLSPGHAGRVDALKIREAKRRFLADFPHVDLVRNAVAHAGEIYASPRAMQKNQLKNHPRLKDWGRMGEHVFLTHEIDDQRTYSVGLEGEIFSIRLNQDSTDKLKAVTAMVESAFPISVAPAAPPAKN